MAVGGIVSVFWGYHQVAGAYPGETDIFEHTLESCQEELTMA